MEAWINEVTMAYGGNWWFLGLFGIVTVVGLVFLKGWKKALIVPGILLTMAVMNPIVYDLWNKMIGRSYWRALWVLPIIPFVAIVPALVVERNRKLVIKAGGLLAWLAIIVMTGSLVYNNGNTTFTLAKNPDKLPEDVVKVGETLLELDERPSTVSDGNLSTYLRQYSGKIKSMYGRSVNYGQPSAIGRATNNQLVAGEYDAVNQTMLNYDYEYLITERGKYGLTDVGFEEAGQAGDYGIYRAVGARTEIREYNELGKMTRITYVDENGEPRNTTEGGYASVIYDYDNLGRITYCFRKDQNGNGKADTNGRAGYLRDYDYFSQVIQETYLSENGDPVSHGCAIRKCEYNMKHKLIRETFYDEYDNPIEIGTGYSRIEHTYTDNGDLSLSYFFNKEGTLLPSGSSYLHAFLYDIKGSDNIVFIAIKDEGTFGLTETIQKDLEELGVQSYLRGKFGYSFIAIITKDQTIEQLDSEPLSYSGSIGEVEYSISSAGFDRGNYCSIIINGNDYSRNERGMNIVVYDPRDKQVLDVFAIDTFTSEMRVSR